LIPADSGQQNVILPADVAQTSEERVAVTGEGHIPKSAR
jgi:hypothetical protein